MRGCPIPPSFGGVGFSSLTAMMLVVHRKDPSGQNQPGWGAQIIYNSREGPAHTDVSSITDPQAIVTVVSLHALGTRPIPAISMSPLHNVQLLPAATVPQHKVRESRLRKVSRTNPSQLPTLRNRLCRNAGARSPDRYRTRTGDAGTGDSVIEAIRFAKTELPPRPPLAGSLLRLQRFHS